MVERSEALEVPFASARPDGVGARSGGAAWNCAALERRGKHRRGPPFALRPSPLSPPLLSRCRTERTARAAPPSGQHGHVDGFVPRVCAVHLREVLSSPLPLWRDLLEVTERILPITLNPDESGVKVLRQPNRKLQPGEIAELVTSYKARATIRSLGKQYVLHEQTVRAHLRRQGVEPRPVIAIEDKSRTRTYPWYWSCTRSAGVPAGSEPTWVWVRRRSGER